MPHPMVINGVIVLLVLGMTYALSSEGAWGAALMFFNVMFAGLIAFNFYEPLAAKLAESASSFVNWADMLCLAGLFLISLIVLRVTTDMIAPAMVRLPTPAYHIGRLVFGLAASLMTMAILLCILETTPVDRRILGDITYASKHPFEFGFDRKWLGFVQHTSGVIFPSYSEDIEPDREFENANVFDPKARWLMDHQNARPYHKEGNADSVPEPESTEAPAPATAAPAAPAPRT
jgi:hypothetical protein